MCYLVKKEEKLVGFLDLRKVYRPRLIYSHQVYKKNMYWPISKALLVYLVHDIKMLMSQLCLYNVAFYKICILSQKSIFSIMGFRIFLVIGENTK